jgi:hypothetical protein
MREGMIKDLDLFGAMPSRVLIQPLVQAARIAVGK